MACKSHIRYYMYVMSRSTLPEVTRRINFAIGLLEHNTPRSEIKDELISNYGVSRRQASRYLGLALQHPFPLLVPERKRVLTVKLPGSLIGRLKALATAKKKSLSALVSEILENNIEG